MIWALSCLLRKFRKKQIPIFNKSFFSFEFIDYFNLKIYAPNGRMSVAEFISKLKSFKISANPRDRVNYIFLFKFCPGLIRVSETLSLLIFWSISCLWYYKISLLIRLSNCRQNLQTLPNSPMFFYFRSFSSVL